MHHTGVLDQVEFADDMVDDIKSGALRTVENFRVQVKRRLSPARVQSFVDGERMAALGLASGAFVGVML